MHLSELYVTVALSNDESKPWNPSSVTIISMLSLVPVIPVPVTVQSPFHVPLSQLATSGISLSVPVTVLGLLLQAVKATMIRAQIPIDLKIVFHCFPPFENY